MLWKTFIDFEIGERETDNVRSLYERLLQRTSHVKVWISYGKFEAVEVAESAAARMSGEGEEVVERGPGVQAVRAIFEKG